MNWSAHLYEIIGWLRRCGVTVHEHAAELPFSGMYRSETREIFLNEPSAFGAVLTIAHEAGHWLGYLIDEKPYSYQRERQAFVYGWHVLQWFEVPVELSVWIACDRATRDWSRTTEPAGTEGLFL